jgi:hypothetical protein
MVFFSIPPQAAQMKTFTLFLLMLVSGLSFATTELHLYWPSSCPHCHEQLKNVEQLRNLSKLYHFQFGPVPVSLVGDRAWEGFSQQTSIEIEE